MMELGGQVQEVDLGDVIERVYVDATGPKVLDVDGSYKGYSCSPERFSVGFHPADHKGIPYSKMTSTERSVALHLVARLNLQTRQRMEQLKLEGGPALRAATRPLFEGPGNPLPVAAAEPPKYKQRPPYFTGLLIKPGGEDAAPARRKSNWWNGQPA
uniref:Uncharacterized protein n=1 Tax=Alexandrium monilatum TaxID=311494 RepID=A0A6T1FIS2_9DINO|mmetsp:Transcript_13536/g.41923  ORF Transcript_13536/g.41923 Transcript_13536/m.41923 type:complete len:157 (-) Transcript_13536:204-674(-)